MSSAQVYQQFSERLHQRGHENRIPLNGTIEVTHRCPLACVQCYNNLPMGDTSARARELTTSEHRTLIDQITAAGCLWLVYTGGEVFARPDFPEIYEYAKRAGLIITLFTNGTLVTPRLADFLAEWRPFSIEITLYGATEDTYERVTGIPGSYARCRRGIDLLLERGLSLSLKSVAIRENHHEIAAMRRLAESLGIDYKFDVSMFPRIDYGTSPLATRVDAVRALRLEMSDAKRWEAQQAAAEAIRAEQRTERSADADPSLYFCAAGKYAFSIDPYGMLRLCHTSLSHGYDLRAGSFREGWDSFLHGIRSQRRTRQTRCVGCGIKKLCVMCPAKADLEHGDTEEPVDHYCHLAHLRAHLLNLSIPHHGDCPFCSGGSRFAELQSHLSQLAGPAPTDTALNLGLLPVLDTSSTAGAGACGRCSC